TASTAAASSAHSPNQIKDVQRSPRLSRGMTTGTRDPESPPRSSRATSLQSETASLIELVVRPTNAWVAVLIACSAMVVPLLVLAVDIGGRSLRFGGCGTRLGCRSARLRCGGTRLGCRSARLALELLGDLAVGHGLPDLIEPVIGLGIPVGLRGRNHLHLGLFRSMQQFGDLFLTLVHACGDGIAPGPDGL